jgi:hypothetical protein
VDKRSNSPPSPIQLRSASKIGDSKSGSRNIAEIHNQVPMMLEIFDPETNTGALVDHAFIVAGGEITKAAKNRLGNKLDATKRVRSCSWTATTYGFEVTNEQGHRQQISRPANPYRLTTRCSAQVVREKDWGRDRSEHRQLYLWNRPTVAQISENPTFQRGAVHRCALRRPKDQYR